MKRIFFLYCILFIAVADAQAGQTTRVCIDDACVEAEISDSDMLRQQGLMLKNRIEETEGMLFVFPIEARHAFWMKNMRFPLDIIWANKDKIIMYIKSDAQPCARDCKVMVPDRYAQYVLEVKSGFVKKHNIKVGDLLNCELP